MITFDDVKNHASINTYIEHADATLSVLGYTDHSKVHVTKVAVNAANILTQLGHSEREAELAKIAGYMHDIGNVVNRDDHSQSGAVMAFHILNSMGMQPMETAVIMSAIGNHDENCGLAVTPIAAALIIADKTDVRRSRVREEDPQCFDEHDRVNYSVIKSELVINKDAKLIEFDVTIDTEICSIMKYFELFIVRMVMCRNAAEFLGVKFSIVANGTKLL